MKAAAAVHYKVHTAMCIGCCSTVHWDREVLQLCALGGVAVAKVKAAPAHLHWLHSGLVAPGKLFATGYFQQNIWISSTEYLGIIHYIH